MSVVEWEWRPEKPEEHECAFETPTEVWGAYALGVLVAIVALITPSAEDAKDSIGPLWWHYRVPEPGLPGYEQIEGYETLDDAKAAVEENRDEFIEMTRQELDDDEE